MLCLVLSDPYEYAETIDTFIEKARKKQEPVTLIFYIPKDALHRFVEGLGEKGWLGSSPMKALEHSMLEGYKLLAKTIFQYAKKQADKLGVELYTELLLGVQEDLGTHLRQRGCKETTLRLSPWLASEDV